MTKRSSAPLWFGDHKTYDGDNPWWTLRFVKPVSAAVRIKIQAHLGLDLEVSLSSTTTTG